MTKERFVNPRSVEWDDASWCIKPWSQDDADYFICAAFYAKNRAGGELYSVATARFLYEEHSDGPEAAGSITWVYSYMFEDASASQDFLRKDGQRFYPLSFSTPVSVEANN